MLDALGDAAVKLRGELGESLSTVEKFSTPLADATTSSLDALKAYSQGVIKDRQNDSESLPFFKRAIELVSAAASAYEGLGTSLYNLGESGLACDNFTKAFQLNARASERERFVIAARYYQMVTGEIENKLSKTFRSGCRPIRATRAPTETWEACEPESPAISTNAAAENLEALRLSPDAGANYANLILSYAALNLS